MFEILETNCEGLSYKENLSDIFLKYIIDINFEKCVRTVKTLYSMTIDNYERDE